MTRRKEFDEYELDEGEEADVAAVQCNSCLASSTSAPLGFPPDPHLARYLGRVCPYCGEGVIQEVES